MSKTNGSIGNNSIFERIPTGRDQQNEREDSSSYEDMHFNGVPTIIEERFDERSRQNGTVSHSDGSDTLNFRQSHSTVPS